jgi:transposase
VHVAAALNSLGALLGVASFEASARGYRMLLRWLQGFGTVELVGVEGTGSYGAGLTQHLRGQGVAVVEVDRPNRQKRRLRGKSDPVDAIAAARAAQSGEATGEAKSRDGNVEVIRVLRLVKLSARKDRTRALNQMHSIVCTAPEPLRAELRGLTNFRLIERALSYRSGGKRDIESTTKTALRHLARRVQFLEAQIAEVDEVVAPLVEATAPQLLAQNGVGIDTAAALLVAAGDNPERLGSERSFAHLCGVAPLDASSGKQQRHRLSRGGDRQANQALWRVVMTRISYDPRTRVYIHRRTKEGLTKREAMRCLKRYVARELYAHLPRPIVA